MSIESSKIIYSDPELEKILAIEGNNRCVDCGSEDPQWASINNSVFVCLNCAGIHRNLGINVSFIRSLVMDSWDDKQLKLLFLGGNSRFVSHLEDYGIIKDNNHLSLNPEKIEKKYLYKASQYYRELLQSELNLSEPPVKPAPDEGKEMIVNDLTKDINNSNYEDGGDQDINNNGEVEDVNEIKVEEPEQKKGFLGKVSGFFSKAADETKKTYKKVEEKVSKMEIKEKIKSTGEKTVVLAKDAGKYVSDKATQVKNSEFVNKVATGTKEGFETVVSKGKKLFKKDEDNNQPGGEVDNHPGN